MNNGINKLLGNDCCFKNQDGVFVIGRFEFSILHKEEGDSLWIQAELEEGMETSIEEFEEFVQSYFDTHF